MQDAASLFCRIQSLTVDILRKAPAAGIFGQFFFVFDEKDPMAKSLTLFSKTLLKATIRKLKIYEMIQK